MADYVSRHPTELCGSSIKAEILWNEWLTVNSVISLNDVLDGSDVSSEKGKPAENANEGIGVNRINQASRRQPIKLQNEPNSRESNKRHCGNIVQKRKMSQLNNSMKSFYRKIIARTNSFN